MNRNDFDFTHKDTDNEQDLFYTSYTPEKENSAYTSKQEYESVSKRAIEVPLPQRPKLSAVITVGAVLLFFGLMLGLMALGGHFNGYSLVLVQLGGVVILAALSIAAPFIDRHFLKKVCTVRTQGTYVGYDYRVRSSKYGTYNIYAPKYEMFINGHYEIRTLDDFSRDLDFSVKMELLANPDGYEIMPADCSISRSGKRTIIKILIVMAVILFVAMPFLMKRVFLWGII